MRIKTFDLVALCVLPLSLATTAHANQEGEKSSKSPWEVSLSVFL